MSTMKKSSDSSTCHPTKALRRASSFVLQKPKKSESFGLPRDASSRCGERGDITEATVSEQTLWSINTAATATAEAEELHSRGSSSQDTAPSLKPSARRPLPASSPVDAPLSPKKLDTTAAQDSQALADTPEAQGFDTKQPTKVSAEATATSASRHLVIEDWHAVLGDRHCASRTTTATKILKEVKQEFRDQNVGRHLRKWYGKAMKAYHERLAQRFPHVVSQDRGRIFVRCTQQVLESQRVVDPFTYGYSGEKAIYGPAKLPEAIHFFFKNRDSPVLEKEVEKCRDEVRKYRKNTTERPPDVMLDEFEDLLNFIERKIQAPEENIMAKKILDSIKFIPVLSRHSQYLAKHIQPVSPSGVPGSNVSSNNDNPNTTPCSVAVASPTNEDQQPNAAARAVLASDSMETDDLFGGRLDLLGLDDDIGDATLLFRETADTSGGVGANFEAFEIAVPPLEPLQVKNEFDPLPLNTQADERANQARNPGVRSTNNGRLENEVFIRSLKDQINQLQSKLEQLRLKPIRRHSSFAQRSDIGREADVSFSHRDEDDSAIRGGVVDRADSRSVCSQKSGRKRGRRVGRKSSANSGLQRSLSSASKRSRHREDATSNSSSHIPGEIEMCSDTSQDKSEKEEVKDVDSYESFDSEDHRVCQSIQALVSPSVARPRHLKSDSKDTDDQSWCSHASSKQSGMSRKESATSVRSPTFINMEEAKLDHVTDVRIEDPFGETGVYTGTVNVATGIPHGKGRFNYDLPGCFYDGEWRNGEWHGIGQLGNAIGDFYEGSLKNGLKHGNGSMVFSDGRKFHGRYVLGEMREGELHYPDGSCFKGGLSDGLPHGRGRSTFADGSWYEGTYRRGTPNGRGTMKWADGSVYEGEFWNSEITGFGKEYRPDGTIRHKGLFRNGVPLRNQATERWK